MRKKHAMKPYGLGKCVLDLVMGNDDLNMVVMVQTKRYNSLGKRKENKVDGVCGKSFKTSGEKMVHRECIQ